MSITYNFNQDLGNTEPAPKYLQAGIHSHVEMVGVKKDVSPNGNKCLIFQFTSPDGLVPDIWEFEPAEQKKAESQQKRIFHILKKFMSEEEAKSLGVINSFDDLCNVIIQKLGNRFMGVKLNAKLVYRGRLSKFPPYTPFLEVMEEGKDSSLRVNEKEMTREEPTSPEVAMETATAVTGNDDDLPF
jgi:hypothetical protein